MCINLIWLEILSIFVDSMENNWRREDVRQKFVNKIKDILHRHMPHTGVDGMQELSKIAIRFEEEIFSNSQNQQDYLQKISIKMISLETKANNDNNQFPAGANQSPIEHTSVESSSQAGQPVMAEWQENVYQRLQAVKDMYFVELKDLFQELNYRCQKPMPPDQSEKFKLYKAQLQRVLNYFNAPKNAIPANFKEEHVEALEERVQNILNSFRPKLSAQQQAGQQQIQNQMGQGQPMQQQSQPQTVQGQPMKRQSQPQLGHMQLMQQQSQFRMGQVPQEQKHITPFQQMNLQPSVSSMMQQPMQHDFQQRPQASGVLLPQQQNTLDQQKQLLLQRGLSEASSTSVESPSQASQPVIAEWQEKIYQRLQVMKDMYFVELEDMFQELNYRCQKTMPPDQSEIFKNYKAQMQRVLSYFNAPKNAIPANFKEVHVEALEKRVQNILNSFRPKLSAQQQPGQQQIQSQMGQGQSMQQQSQPQMGQGQPKQQQSQPQLGHMQLMQQQSQSHMGQVPQQQKHVTPFEQMSLQPSVSSMQPNTLAPLQNSTMHLIQESSGQASQQTMQTPMQLPTALNTQGTDVNSFQQSSGNQIPHNPLQHNNISSLQQRGIDSLQSNLGSLQQRSNNPHLHLQQAQQLNHLQQQRILKMQQQRQVAQLQHQLQAPQVSQLQQQLNDNDAKLKQGPMKSSFMQHHQMNQHAVFQQQQKQHLKQALFLSAPSPQILPAGYLQVSQQSSPQADQQSILASPLQSSKVGTPLQQATFPFLNPSSSNPPVPSLFIDDSERRPSVTTSVSNVDALGFQHSVSAVSLAQSLAIGIPRISILILMLGLMLIFLMLGLMTLGLTRII